jgi:hypothetical protein
VRIPANLEDFHANETFANKYLDLRLYLIENRRTAER